MHSVRRRSSTKSSGARIRLVLVLPECMPVVQGGAVQCGAVRCGAVQFMTHSAHRHDRRFPSATTQRCSCSRLRISPRGWSGLRRQLSSTRRVYCIVWYGMVWYAMLFYAMLCYCRVQYSTVQYSKLWLLVWYGMVWNGMAWYSIVYSIIYSKV